MLKLEADEVREIQINMLSYIDRICKNTGLRYSLCYGTLIGAIRHNGFIPWDDDIDIIMPRKDMDLLIELVNQSNEYCVVDFCSNEQYIYPFPKITAKSTHLKSLSPTMRDDIMGFGVYIDIFPIDGMPENEDDQKKHYAKVNKLWRKVLHCSDYYYYDRSNGKLAKVKNIAKAVVYYPIHLLRKNMGRDYYYQRFLREIKKYALDDSKFAGNLVSSCGWKEIQKAELFCRYQSHVFEENNYSIISEYDAFLRSIYGDYMKLPPAEQRVTPHAYEFYIDK